MGVRVDGAARGLAFEDAGDVALPGDGERYEFARRLVAEATRAGVTLASAESLIEMM